MSAASVIEGAGSGQSVRDLLDQARAAEGADLIAARSLIQQARVLARSTADAPGEAEALYRLASVSYRLGYPDEAFGLALEARDAARGCSAVNVEVWSLTLVGVVHYQAGNYSQALENLLQALEIHRTTDDLVDQSNLLNTIAAVHHSMRDTDRAIVTYEAALEANRRHLRPEFDAVALANMAKVRAERHENLLAVSLGEAALELAREHLPEDVPEILSNLAEAYAEMHLVPRAKACLDEADAVLLGLAEHPEPTQSSVLVAVRVARGRVCLADDDLPGAVTVLEGAADLAAKFGLKEQQLVIHELLADVLKRLGQFEEALAHREASYRVHTEVFNRDTDLRIKTLQIAHDTVAARDQAELLRIRTTELERLVSSRTEELRGVRTARGDCGVPRHRHRRTLDPCRRAGS
jgi:tetratricopeptide (TPR) repeat protein